MIVWEVEIYGIDFCLCGEMVGDFMCVVIFIGFGYCYLFMNGCFVVWVKYLLRCIDYVEVENFVQCSLEV